jgi:hypothetical protein
LGGHWSRLQASICMVFCEGESPTDPIKNTQTTPSSEAGLALYKIINNSSRHVPSDTTQAFRIPLQPLGADGYLVICPVGFESPDRP